MGISNCREKNYNLMKQKITKDAWKRLETQTLPVILKAGCMEILWHIGISVSPVLSILPATRNTNSSLT